MFGILITYYLELINEISKGNKVLGVLLYYKN